MERPSPYADSPLLAEVHRTFPALLYDQGRFRNIQDVFRYVQGQMRARYDVFSNSQRAFEADDPVYQSRRLVVTMPAQMPEMFMHSLSTPPVLATSPETRRPLRASRFALHRRCTRKQPIRRLRAQFAKIQS